MRPTRRARRAPKSPGKPPKLLQCPYAPRGGLMLALHVSSWRGAGQLQAQGAEEPDGQASPRTAWGGAAGPVPSPPLLPQRSKR